MIPKDKAGDVIPVEKPDVTNSKGPEMTNNEFLVYAEMARRKQAFHADKEWHQIDCWGLFKWGQVAQMIKEGKLLTGMGANNQVVWVKPTKEVWEQCIKPLCDKHTLTELTHLAGWSAG